MPPLLKEQASGAGRSAALLAATTLDEFHQRACRLGLLGSDPRFLTLVVDPSNKCNLRCRMCYFRYDPVFKAPPVFLTPEQFRSMTQNLLAHTRTLTLSCGNEPLTSPYFVDLLQAVGRYRPPHLDFVTNGLLLTPRVSEAISACGVTEVMISVDAPRQATYEAIRVGADFKRLLKNLETLVAVREKAGKSTPRLRFNVTLMRSNIEELEELVILAANLGVSSLDFRHMLIYEGLGMEEESLFFHQDLANLWLARARQKAEALGLALVQIPEPFGRPTGNRPETGKSFFPALKKAGRLIRENPLQGLRMSGYRLRDGIRKVVSHPRLEKEPYCLLPFTYSLINSGGQVLPCPHGPGEAPAGVITPDTPFSAIWLGAGLRSLRQRILNDDPPAMCQKCSTRIARDPNNYDYFRPGKH